MTAVFLDLDGTLMDSRPGIIASLTAAFHEIGRADLTENDMTWMIGPSFAETFPKMGIAEPDHAIEAYRRHYDAGGMFDAQVFDGILDMLTRLTTDGYRLYLATAKPITPAKKITKHFGIAPSMLAEFGPELDGTLNFKGDLLAHALEVTGEDPKNAIMVGDRHHDIHAAAHVGMSSVAVKWGYGSQEEWSDATHSIDRPSDLHDLLSNL